MCRHLDHEAILLSNGALSSLRSVLVWGISVSGLLLTLAMVVRVAASLGSGAPVPWVRAAALITTGIALIGLGVILTEREAVIHGRWRLFGAWMAWELGLLGAVLGVRFLVVIFDGLAGYRQPFWAVEVTMVIVALVVGLGGYVVLSKMSGSAKKR